MKTKSLKTLAITSLVLLSTTVHATEGSSSTTGNGGQAVVCTQNDKEIWALRDLWEIEFIGDRLNHTHQVVRSELPYQDQINAAVQKVRAVAPDYAYALEFTLRDIGRPEVREAIRSDLDLTLTQDLGFSLNGINCRTVQLADYHLRLGVSTLWVDNEYIAQLPPTDRAGLELHEAIYRLERESFGQIHSEHTRLLVGLLLSDASLTREELFALPLSNRYLKNVRYSDDFANQIDNVFSDGITNNYPFGPLSNSSWDTSEKLNQMTQLFDSLPPTSHQELLGHWQASITTWTTYLHLTGYLVNQKTYRSAYYRTHLAVNPDSHDFTWMAVSEGSFLINKCNETSTSDDHGTPLLAASPCLTATARPRQGIRNHRIRRPLRYFEQRDFRQMEAYLGTLSRSQEAQTGLTCKVLTLTGDHLLCRYRFTGPPHVRFNQTVFLMERASAPAH